MIYLLYGEDDFSRKKRVDQLLSGYARSEISYQWEPKRALTLFRLSTFFGPSVVIWDECELFSKKAEEHLLEEFQYSVPGAPGISKDKTIIMVAETVDKRLKATKYLKSIEATLEEYKLPSPWDTQAIERMVKTFAKDLGLHPTPEAISLIAQLVGSDPYRINRELEKLDLLCENGQITEETVGLGIERRNQRIFDLCNALLNKKLNETVTLLKRIVPFEAHPLQVLAVLLNRIHVLYTIQALAGRDYAEIAKQAGIKNPKQIYFLKQELKGIAPDHLWNCKFELLRAESSIKEGSNHAELMLEKAIFKILDFDFIRDGHKL